MTPTNENPRSRATKAATPTGSTSSFDDATKAMADAAHVVIGFGVLGWNKFQVRRREVMKSLTEQRQQVETHLDGAREQISTAIRSIDTRLAPVRKDLDSKLDMVSEKLPEPARDMLTSARTIARDTEHTVRQAVGAL